MSSCRVTYIGGPTALIEVAGVRLLTDPTFDPAGRNYKFGGGTGSTKTAGPAIAADELGRIDAVLLSHEQHADNLDDAGRALLPQAGSVITAKSGAERLGGNALGLDPFESTTVGEVTVTATPCRHGPRIFHAVVGDVIGFMLEWAGQEKGPLWVTGDTVYYRGLSEVDSRFDIGTALIHLGGVRFTNTGPAKYTMSANDAARLVADFKIPSVLPIHYEGWKHFKEGRAEAEAAFAEAGLADRVHWLAAGAPEEISV